jgi:hypothetical protein
MRKFKIASVITKRFKLKSLDDIDVFLFLCTLLFGEVNVSLAIKKYNFDFNLKPTLCDALLHYSPKLADFVPSFWYGKEGAGQSTSIALKFNEFFK